jgi:hypothetical protein
MSTLEYLHQREPVTAGPAQESTLPAAELALDRLRAGMMQQSLSHLLNRVPGARQALRHLALLETALAEHGTPLLAGLSRPVLVKLCRQLASLPVAPDDAPLLDLQERLLCALESAPALGPPEHRPVQLHELSDFLTEEKLLVAEASYDDFAAAAAGFATTQRSAL